MCWSVYSDFETTSPNGRYTLEVRSPHNGDIDHRDGTPASDDEFAYRFREEQCEFRYRLIDHGRSTPLKERSEESFVWERWQAKRESSPVEALVTDDGWSILRTGNHEPSVIVVSPAGSDVLRVKITEPGVSEPHSQTLPDCSWTPVDELPYVDSSGFHWTEHSWRYFLEHRNRRYFIWRTVWGTRLVLDLDKPALLAESELSADLAGAITAREIESVQQFLESFSSRMSQIRRWLQPASDEEKLQRKADPSIWYVTSAFHLFGVHRIASAIPFLREWEEIDHKSCWTGSMAIEGGREVQAWRPMIHHTLRRLGQEPRGYATYTFRDAQQRHVPMAELLPDRRARTDQIRGHMTAAEVLSILGSPDHVRIGFRPHGDRYQPWDEWEYDFLSDGTWTTYRMFWEDLRLTRVETVAADWMDSPRREEEILYR